MLLHLSFHRNSRTVVLLALFAAASLVSSCASTKPAHQASATTAATPVRHRHMAAPERAQVWGFVQTGQISKAGLVPDLSDRGIRQAIADATPEEIRTVTRLCKVVPPSDRPRQRVCRLIRKILASR